MLRVRTYNEICKATCEWSEERNGVIEIGCSIPVGNLEVWGVASEVLLTIVANDLVLNRSLGSYLCVVLESAECVLECIRRPGIGRKS